MQAVECSGKILVLLYKLVEKLGALMFYSSFLSPLNCYKFSVGTGIK